MTEIMSLHGWLAVLSLAAAGALGLLLANGLLRKKQFLISTTLTLASLAVLPALVALIVHWSLDYGFTTLDTMNSSIIAMAVSDDGTLLVIADSEGVIKSYDMTTDQSVGGTQVSDVRALHVIADQQIVVLEGSGVMQQSGPTLDLRQGESNNPNTRLAFSGSVEGGVFVVRETLDAKGGASVFEVTAAFPDRFSLLIETPVRPTAMAAIGGNAQQNGFAVGFANGGVTVVGANSGQKDVGQSTQQIAQESKADPLHKMSITRIAASASGLIVTADLEGDIRVWRIDEKSGLPMRVENFAVEGSSEILRHVSPVTSAVFSPDGKFVLTASSDNTARLWDAATGKEIAVLRGHDANVRSAVFSSDSKLVLTASSDMTARLWDAATGKAIAVLRGHEYTVKSAVFSPDGKLVLTASSGKSARLWDAATGKEIALLKGHEDTVNSAVFSPDGRLVLTASSDKTARLWDAATGKAIAVLGGHEDTVKSAVFSPDGRLVVTASDDNTARLWDAATGKEIAVLRGHEDFVNSAVFSPDGRLVLTASSDKTARLWDAATGKAIAVLRGHESTVWSAVFSPDGRLVVTASDDNTARLWDAATGKAIAVLRGHENTVNSAVFSPDGRLVLTASIDKTARLWDAATGKAIVVPSCLGCLAISISDDRKSVEVIDYLGRIQRFDPVSGVRTFESRTLAQEHAIALKSGRVLETRGDGTVGMIEADGSRLELSGHSAMITQAVELADDRIVTGATDGTIRILDPAMHRIFAAIDFWPGLASLLPSIWASLSSSEALNQTAAVDTLPDPVPSVFIVAATFGQEWEIGQTGNTPDKAILAEYYSKYWLPANCDKLPDKIAHLQFDAALDHGPKRAIMLLQAALDLPTDGIFGPSTQSQAKSAPEDDLALRYLDRRLEFINSVSLQSGITNNFTKRFQALAKELGLVWPRSASAS